MAKVKDNDYAITLKGIRTNDEGLSDSKQEKLSQIMYAIEDENRAIEGYYRLLTYIKDKASVDKINEIIADEKNHIEVLNEILKSNDNIEPATT